MKTGRGKAVAVTTGVLGLAVLAGVFAQKDRIVAEWYLRKLESKDSIEKAAAIEQLIQLKSTRAARVFTRLLERSPEFRFPPLLLESYGPGFTSFYSNTWSAALLKMGRTGVPGLVQALKHEEPQVRLLAACALGKLGPQAKEALPILLELRRGYEPPKVGMLTAHPAINGLRWELAAWEAAGEALKKIQRE